MPRGGGSISPLENYTKESGGAGGATGGDELRSGDAMAALRKFEAKIVDKLERMDSRVN